MTGITTDILKINKAVLLECSVWLTGPLPHKSRSIAVDVVVLIIMDSGVHMQAEKRDRVQ